MTDPEQNHTEELANKLLDIHVSEVAFLFTAVMAKTLLDSGKETPQSLLNAIRILEKPKSELAFMQKMFVDGNLEGYLKRGKAEIL